MDQNLTKTICQSLLNSALISDPTADTLSQFQLLSEQLLDCFPELCQENECDTENLRKILEEVVSESAKILGVDSNIEKIVMTMLFEKINKKYGLRTKRRKLKVGRHRQVYSDQEEQGITHQIGYEQTGGSASEIIQPRKIKINNPKRKYQTFDQDFKQQVCQTATQHGIQHATKKYELSARKITTWLQSQTMNLLGKGRKPFDPSMQFNLSIWILKKIWNQIPLTQRIIRIKAIAMKTRETKFNGSKGWLEKFFLRHVQLKSCFDTKNKLEMRDDCAKYHKCAFSRVLKDYENLSKVELGINSLVTGDLNQIVYGKGTHSLLQLGQDQCIDQQRDNEAPFYDYSKLQGIMLPSCKLVKKQEEQIEQYEQQESEDEQDEQNDSEEEENLQLSSQIVKKFEESIKDNSEDSKVKIYEEDDSKDNQPKIEQPIL